MRYSSSVAAVIQLVWIAMTCCSDVVGAATALSAARIRSTGNSTPDAFLLPDPFRAPISMPEFPNHARVVGTSTKKHRPFLRRRLPGNDYTIDGWDMMSAEAGFALGLSCFIILLLLLCCCCCGRRRGGGSSCLWDLVAVVCLWEMCCDNDGVGDGFLRF
jgi:hypothetical protein